MRLQQSKIKQNYRHKNRTLRQSVLHSLNTVPLNLQYVGKRGSTSLAHAVSPPLMSLILTVCVRSETVGCEMLEAVSCEQLVVCERSQAAGFKLDLWKTSFRNWAATWESLPRRQITYTATKKTVKEYNLQ